MAPRINSRMSGHEGQSEPHSGFATNIRRGKCLQHSRHCNLAFGLLSLCEAIPSLARDSTVCLIPRDRRKPRPDHYVHTRCQDTRTHSLQSHSVLSFGSVQSMFCHILSPIFELAHLEQSDLVSLSSFPTDIQVAPEHLSSSSRNKLNQYLSSAVRRIF